MNLFLPEPQHERIRTLVWGWKSSIFSSPLPNFISWKYQKTVWHPLLRPFIIASDTPYTAADLPPEGLPSPCPSHALFLSFLLSDLKGQLESDIQSKRNVRLEEENNSEHTEGMTPILQKSELCLWEHEPFFPLFCCSQSLRDSAIIR